MKKTTFTCLGFIILIVNFSGCSSSGKKNSPDSSNTTTAVELPQTSDSVTLTGMPWNDAKKLIANFRKDTTCDGKQTSVWLDSTWVAQTCKTMKNEKLDGIRFYFAKENTTNALTVVLVSTKDGGYDKKAESDSDHIDYFNHPKLATTTLQNVSGALMFANLCPCNERDPKWSQSKPIRCKDAWEAISNFYNSDKKINIHSEWFEREVFTDLIKNHTGIRIYFAKHTDSTAAASSHIGKSAFILFPTYEYTDNSGHVSQKDDLSYSFPNEKKSKPKQQPGVGSAADNGEQCPDNCNGAAGN